MAKKQMLLSLQKGYRQGSEEKGGVRKYFRELKAEMKRSFGLQDSR